MTNPSHYTGFPRHMDPGQRIKKRGDIDTAWLQEAACRGMSVTTFFPEPGDMASIAKARATCATCQVRAACAEASKDEVYGVWSGLTPLQRGKRPRRELA